MPLWRIYHPEGSFTAEDRKGLAQAITESNHHFVHIPKFYVNVFFHEMPAGSMFVGGEVTTNFIRIVTDTIAVAMTSPEMRAAAMEGTEAFLEPFIKAKGYDWELHFDETPRDLWRVQGLIAPEQGTEAAELWFRENKPIPYYDTAPV